MQRVLDYCHIKFLSEQNIYVRYSYVYIYHAMFHSWFCHKQLKLLQYLSTQHKADNMNTSVQAAQTCSKTAELPSYCQFYFSDEKGQTETYLSSSRLQIRPQ
jgi:hypothetical protein